jgi:hypothetical protein
MPFLHIFSANKLVILCSMGQVHYVCCIILLKLFRWQRATNDSLEDCNLVNPAHVCLKVGVSCTGNVCNEAKVNKRSCVDISVFTPNTLYNSILKLGTPYADHSVDIHVCIHTYVVRSTYIYTSIHTHTYIHTHIHKYIHTYIIHTYIHNTHTHAYIICNISLNVRGV